MIISTNNNNNNKSDDTLSPGKAADHASHIFSPSGPSSSLSKRSEEPPPTEPEGEPEGGDEGGEAPPGGLTDADIDSNWEEAIETFDAMDLPEELLRGIYAYGFEKPSAIQQRAIKPTRMGRDLIAQAQSGTVSCRHPLTYGSLPFLSPFVFCFVDCR